MFEENPQAATPQQPSPAPLSENMSTPQQSVQQGVPPNEPVDMFAQTDTASSTLPAPSAAEQPYHFEEEPDAKPWFLQKKFLFIVLGSVLFLIVIIFGVQFALTFFQQNQQTPQGKPPAPAQNTAPQQPVKEQQPQQASQQQQQNQPTLQNPSGQATQGVQPSAQQPSSQAKYTDGDGLTDEEEAKLGTDPTAVDTDKDGLTDREEVKVFHTDPRNPDTDGDGYLDGVEVKNGYNPNGPGKLQPLSGETIK